MIVGIISIVHQSEVSESQKSIVVRLLRVQKEGSKLKS